MVAGVNLVAGVEIPAILAGWISKTELHESGSGGPRLVAGVEFFVRRVGFFTVLALRDAPSVRFPLAGSQKQNCRILVGGSAAGRGVENSRNPAGGTSKTDW